MSEVLRRAWRAYWGVGRVRVWVVRDYVAATGEPVGSESRYWTRGGAERFAALHRRWFGTRGGEYELRVERVAP